jgi:hypothetical protein
MILLGVKKGKGRFVTSSPNTCIFLANLIKGRQNPIITRSPCLESYYNDVHVRSPIIAKRIVWRVIIANFSNLRPLVLLQNESPATAAPDEPPGGEPATRAGGRGPPCRIPMASK